MLLSAAEPVLVTLPKAGGGHGIATPATNAEEVEMGAEVPIDEAVVVQNATVAAS